MDPVVDKDDSYSDFEDFDASSYLNDPNEGFLNGGFEEGDVNSGEVLKTSLMKMSQLNIN